MLERDDEHCDAGLQEADIAWAIGQHRHLRANGVFGFSALEGDTQHRPLRRLIDLADRGVGHDAVGHQIPRVLAFTGAARGLREDADFDRVYLAVGALDPGRGDVVAGLDIGNALLDQGATTSGSVVSSGGNVEALFRSGEFSIDGAQERAHGYLTPAKLLAMTQSGL